MWLRAWTYLNINSIVSTISRYRVVIKVVFTSQHNCERYQKIWKEKSLQKKRDVGMTCRKVHKQGRIKVMVNIQSPFLYLCSFVKRCRYGLGFVHLPSILSFLVCVYFGIPTYISFLSCTHAICWLLAIAGRSIHNSLYRRQN